MAGQEKIVVDAGVVVKWFLEEEHSERALAVREDYLEGSVDLAAPDLLPYEVLNALRYDPDFGKADLERVMESLRDYQLQLEPMVPGTLGMAYEHGVTIYDASYAALADEMGAVLYTADERFLGKLGDRDRARHISEYGQ